MSLLSREGVRELQVLIFVLAFFHSLSSVLTFSLGLAKVSFSCLLDLTSIQCTNYKKFLYNSCIG